MHRSADIDALATAYYLSECLGDCEIASDGLDRLSRSMCKIFDIKVLSEIDPSKYEKIIVVDTASREQLGKFRDVRIDSVLDHHESNDIDAKERIVDVSYPSCSELVYDLYPVKPSREAAFLLLGGIITDTVWFRHANQRTFRIFGTILEESSVDMEELRRYFNSPHTFSEKIAALKAFQRLRYRSEGNKIVAVTQVSANESVVANAVLEFADIVFVASARGGRVRITGRSREVNLLEIFKELAEDFGCTYGGHKRAAGANCAGDAEALLNALLILGGKRLRDE